MPWIKANESLPEHDSMDEFAGAVTHWLDEIVHAGVK